MLHDAPGKFHLDDDARLSFTAYFSIFTDPDSLFRPWRFAHRDPMPAFVLFPRSESLIKRTRDTIGEIRWRCRNIVRAAQGETEGF